MTRGRAGRPRRTGSTDAATAALRVECRPATLAELAAKIEELDAARARGAGGPTADARSSRLRRASPSPRTTRCRSSGSWTRRRSRSSAPTGVCCSRPVRRAPPTRRSGCATISRPSRATAACSRWRTPAAGSPTGRPGVAAPRVGRRLDRRRARAGRGPGRSTRSARGGSRAADHQPPHRALYPAVLDLVLAYGVGTVFPSTRGRTRSGPVRTSSIGTRNGTERLPRQPGGVPVRRRQRRHRQRHRDAQALRHDAARRLRRSC